MGEALTSSTYEEFAEWVHDALNRLYDTPYLRTHPLAGVLASEETDPLQRTQNLRRVLLDAIQAMRPAAGTPAHSPDWRAYRLLELRYIEGLSPLQVMQELALGRSQYFRDQARVLQALTAALWDHCQKPARESNRSADEGTATQDEVMRSEAERLSGQATWEPVDIAGLLKELRAVMDPLARTKGGSVNLNLLRRVTIPHADRVLLRQACLNVVGYALDVASAGRVEVSTFSDGREEGIRVLARVSAAESPPDRAHHREAGLDLCRRFVTAMGGVLHLDADDRGRWQARLAWSASGARVLLVVDDNEGFIELCSRYLARYDWRVVGAASAAEARQVMADVQPTVILLDVMMPHEDGWEFLTALRHGDDARDTPVIVCSVLSQPQLAQALGAVTYLPKPLSPQALLRALAPWGGAETSLAPRP